MTIKAKTPIKILILNLMPTKEETERQLLSRLKFSFLPIETTFLTTATYEGKNTSKEHMEKFYKTLDQVKDEYFDGMIITGAPVETLEFDEVLYWEELKTIMDWAKIHTKSVLHICWGAQAGIYYHYGVQKRPLKEKLSGIYAHHVYEKEHPLMQGIKEGFVAPHSRYTTVLREDVLQIPELTLLAGGDETECYIVADTDCKNIFVMGHMEYDLMTLDGEYHRDLAKEGLNPAIPHNYYPDNDPSKKPEFTWFNDSTVFFGNWIHNYLKTDQQQEEPHMVITRQRACFN